MILKVLIVVVVGVLVFKFLVKPLFKVLGLLILAAAAWWFFSGFHF